MRVGQRIRTQARRLFRQCVRDGQLDEERVRAVLGQLVRRRVRAQLPLLYAFFQLVKLEEKRRTAKVFCAIAPDESTQSEFKKLLEQRFPGLRRVEFEVEPDLIGGVKVQVGSYVLDASIAGRLQQLAEQF